MKLIRILLIVICCQAGNTLFSQQDTLSIRVPHGALHIRKNCSDNLSSYYAAGSLNVGENMMQESEKTGILSDKVIVQLNFDTTCKLTGYTIIRSGQLTSFNALVQVFCDELMAVYGNNNGTCPFSCDGTISGNITVPFSFQVQ